MQSVNPFPNRWRLIVAASLVAAAIVIAMLATGITASAQSNNPQRAAVTGLSATPGSNPGEIDVTWDAHPAGATEYRVAWAPDGGSFRRPGNTDWNAKPTATGMTIAGLTEGSDYKVKVRARFDSNPKSRWSSVATATATEAPQPTPTPEPTPEPTPPSPTVTPPPPTPAPPDYAADRVTGLGLDVSNTSIRPLVIDYSVDGDGNPRDYYNFQLGESAEVSLSLRKLDFNADLFLEDKYGNVLASSENQGTVNEDIVATLPVGNDYHIRVEALEPGQNDYRLRIVASEPNDATLVTVPEVTSPPPVYIPPPEPETEEDDEQSLRADTCTANTSTTCTATVNGIVNGELETGSDVDYFKVALQAKRYVFELLGDATNDGTLEGGEINGIYNSSNNLKNNTEEFYTTGIRSPYEARTLVAWEPGSAGNYFVKVGSSGNDKGTYKLAIRRDEQGETPATAGTVAVNGSASGRFEDEDDIDWFEVELQASKIYQIDVKGSATGHGSAFDPMLLGLYNSSSDLRTGTSDDNGGIFRNSQATFSTESSGASGPGDYYVSVKHDSSSIDPQGTYKVFVTDITDGYPDDFTDDTSTTATVTVNGSAEGEIEYRNDVDWFKVTLTGGTKYRIEVVSHESHGPLGGHHLHNPDLRGIYNSSGNYMNNTRDENSGFFLNARVDFTPGSSGEYYIAAGAGRNADREYWEGVYEVRVRECIPPLCTGYSEGSVDCTVNTSTTCSMRVASSARGNIFPTQFDQDWWAINLQSGGTYLIDLQGEQSSSGTLPNPKIGGIHNSSGNYISGTINDDGEGLTHNSESRVVFTATSTGTYYISVASEDGVGTYTLTVTDLTL